MLGVGLNKTGTKTLGTCFERFGLRHVTWDRAAFDLWRVGRVDALLDRMERHDAFEDWPWPLLWRDVDPRFPEARFVLTVRRDPDVWFDSLCRHAERTGPTVFREAIYGHAMPHGHRDEHVAFYERHNAALRAHFRDRPGKLLEVCWERGDGWDELAPFLGHETPAEPFPHENARPAARPVVDASR